MLGAARRTVEHRFHEINRLLRCRIGAGALVRSERCTGVGAAAAAGCAEEAAFGGAGAVSGAHGGRGVGARRGASERERGGAGARNEARATGLEEAGGAAVELGEVIEGRGIGALVVEATTPGWFFLRNRGGGRVGLPFGRVKIRLETVKYGRFRIEGCERRRTPWLDNDARGGRILCVGGEGSFVAHVRRAESAVFAAAAMYSNVFSLIAQR